jgi:hypothetical protein
MGRHVQLPDLGVVGLFGLGLLHEVEAALELTALQGLLRFADLRRHHPERWARFS